jgi:hypothetical protein
LIAPFAFLGDDASIERIGQLYRNPQPDTAVSRGMLFFLPNNPSFYVLPGLERELRSAFDRPMLERIAAEDATGRLLLVNTTNVDLGQMRAWDLVAEARRALTRNEDGYLHGIVLASAGIPGIFPARGIGDYLYVDGAITGNILYFGDVREEDGVLARWRAAHPGGPLPRVRYWVIFNNQVRFPPQVIQAAARALLGDLQQSGALPAAGDPGKMARPDRPRDDHEHADLDLERDPASLCQGRDPAAQAPRGRAGAADLGPRGLGAVQARHLRQGSDERACRHWRAHGRRPGELAHGGALRS